VRVLDFEHGPTPAEVIAAHVAVPDPRPRDRAFVRLNMIASADGGSAVAGLSGGLGNRDDHAVFGGLRAQADVVIVGMSTAIVEHYHPPESAGLQIYVVTSRPDVSANPTLFDSDRVMLVIPADAPPTPAGVSELRVGTGGKVDLAGMIATLADKVVMVEGGPTLAGTMTGLGLIDEFFLTVSPRVISGSSARVVHGPEADPATWDLRHGFVDDEGFLFLRYCKSGAG
jgi:riboflavin biosynthesis pyrimidine reductase